MEPGKSTQNSYIEGFNRTCRDTILNIYVFKTLNEVRDRTEVWLREYNHEWPHDSLGDLTLNHSKGKTLILSAPKKGMFTITNSYKLLLVEG